MLLQSHSNQRLNLAGWALRKALADIVTRGTLTVHTASGATLRFGDGTGEPITVRFADSRAQWAFLIDADGRLGELYMDRRFLIERGTLFDFVSMMLREAQNATHPWIARLIDDLRTRLRIFRAKNLPARSRQNVAHHYDLDSRLYELFLDEGRQYSCAYFEHDGQTLDDAQRAKKEHLASKLKITPGTAFSISAAAGAGSLCILPPRRRIAMSSASRSRPSSSLMLKPVSRPSRRMARPRR